MKKKAYQKIMRGSLWAVLFLCSCAGPTQQAKETTLDLKPVRFEDLPLWTQDHQAEALPAFLKSCAVIDKKDGEQSMGLATGVSYADWQKACHATTQIHDTGDTAVRAYFETYFTPYKVRSTSEGLFTGYYEAQLHGSLTRKGPYQTPLWQRPDDMLTIDLGDFRESLKGQKITGKIDGHSFVPYDERAQVARGSLLHRAKPLVWVDDPIGAFFLEIQGSGQVSLDNGNVIRVGYDAQNGHGYTPIGRVLADRGELERPVTMQKIRTWLATHPDRAQEVMDTNPSVVFFRKSERDGAVGAQGVTLTPGRSLAVDRSYLPLGVPLWLVTPQVNRLVVAQDTGGAIKGAVRGDLFMGAGPEAEAWAGRMQDAGTYYILLPKKTAAP